MSFFNGEFGKNYYTIAGLGKHPLVLLHGMGSSHKEWFCQRPVLKKYFQVIAMDHAGSGKSVQPEEELSIERMAKDVGHLLDHLNFPRAIVLGSSMGGVIAQTFAAQAPERVEALIVSATFVVAENLIHQVLTPLLKSKASPQVRIKAVLPLFFSEPFLKNETKAVAKYIEHAENLAPPREVLQRQVRALLNFIPPPLKSNLKAPVLVMAGSEDVITPPTMAEGIVARYPHAQLHICMGAKHLLHIERAEEFNRVVLNFLNQKSRSISLQSHKPSRLT